MNRKHNSLCALRFELFNRVQYRCLDPVTAEADRWEAGRDARPQGGDEPQDRKF